MRNFSIKVEKEKDGKECVIICDGGCLPVTVNLYDDGGRILQTEKIRYFWDRPHVVGENMRSLKRIEFVLQDK